MSKLRVIDKDKADKNVSRLTGKKAKHSWEHWTDDECRTVEALCGDIDARIWLWRRRRVAPASIIAPQNVHFIAIITV